MPSIAIIANMPKLMPTMAPTGSPELGSGVGVVVLETSAVGLDTFAGTDVVVEVLDEMLDEAVVVVALDSRFMIRKLTEEAYRLDAQLNFSTPECTVRAMRQTNTDLHRSMSSSERSEVS